MKKKLHDLAAFMCESGVSKYRDCKNVKHLSRAVASAEKKYRGNIDETFFHTVGLKRWQYLEYKIFLTLLFAEAIPVRKPKFINAYKIAA